MQILEQCFRVYTTSERFDDTIIYYEQLQRTSCSRRVTIVETGVVVAKVGGFLIMSQDEEFDKEVRKIEAIFYVDNLEETTTWCVNHGAELLRAPRKVTGGSNAIIRNPDGLIVECFQAGA